MSGKRSMSLTVSHLPTPLIREVKNSASVSGGGRRHSMFSLESRQTFIGGTSRRDRTRKRKDETPDKSTTPSQEQDESSTPFKNIIWNEEIEKLQIKPQDLRKVWTPQPPTVEKPLVKVSVQKVKKVTKMEKPKYKFVTIAKPAPPDVPVQPVDYSGFAGPRYNEAREVIPFSYLGTYEDFHKEAIQRGKIIPEPQGDLDREEIPSVKYEKQKGSTCAHGPEASALRNWYYRMMERKKQQAHISRLLEKAPEGLVMNQSDNYHALQKQRYLIDRTIPKVDYGKGYRVGSEFWSQQEQFGDDQTGLHMTLTQTQRGYPPPIEHVGLSQVVKKEKGCDWMQQNNLEANLRWQKSEFLNRRQKQLQPYIEELDPWRPNFDLLQVVGSNKPQNSLGVENNYHKHIDASLDSSGQQNVDKPKQDQIMEASEEEKKEVHSNELATEKGNEPAFGPSLLFAGQPARWTGSRLPTNVGAGIETIVNFEAFSGERTTSFLELVNDGTTSIYYDWKKMFKENSFGLRQKTEQRFYFNNSSGVILPGDTLQFPFVFKSTNAGVFTEQWKLETRPVLCSGAPLVVTLRGVALQRDEFREQREELEKELHHKQAQQIIFDLLDEVINGIRTPEPCHSPIDAYITEEEIFLRNNYGLKYNHEIVTQLKGIHSQLFEADVQAENVWSLSVDDLQDNILLLDDEEEEKREMLLHQMNSLVGQVTYIPHVPLEQNLNLFGLQIFGEAIDKIAGQSLLLRHFQGLVDSELDITSKETVTSAKSQVSVDQGQDDLSTGRAGDAKRANKVADGKSKVDSGKDRPKTGTKDVKTAKPVKADSKATSSSSRKTPTSITSTTSAPGSTQGDKTYVDSSGSRISSPDSSLAVHEVEVAIAEKLYKETFTVQVYDILGDMADRMDDIFSSLKKEWRL